VGLRRADEGAMVEGGHYQSQEDETQMKHWGSRKMKMSLRVMFESMVEQLETFLLELDMLDQSC